MGMILAAHCTRPPLRALLSATIFIIPRFLRIMTSPGLESLITCDLLRAMARDVTYTRGYAYAQEGRVQEVAMLDGVLTARVEGTENYRVRLFRQGDTLDFDCTCPVGNELRFCKHCVAAGLAWLMAQGTWAGAEMPGSAPGDEVLARIHTLLDGLDAPALRELLLSEARLDGDLRERLLLREAAQDADPAAVLDGFERRSAAA
jgi:uncharacterized Zn finger protein